MAKDNNIYNARYAPPEGARRRAHASAEYLTRDRGEVAVYGDPERFREAVKARCREMDGGERPGEKGAYVSLVLSPKRGNEMKDADFERLLPAWTETPEGEQLPYFAAVHRDTGSAGNGEGHDHMHVLVARDAYDKRELADTKRQSKEVIKTRERLVRQRERRAREYEAARAAEREPDPDPEREAAAEIPGRETPGREAPAATLEPPEAEPPEAGPEPEHER